MYNIGDCIIFRNALGADLFGRIIKIWHKEQNVPITYEVFCLGEVFLVEKEYIDKKISEEMYEQLMPRMSF